MKPSYRDLPLNFWILALSVFAMRIGQFVVLPFLSILLTAEFHSSPTVIGLVVGVGFFAYAVSSINCGHLSDRFGAKTVMWWSLLLAGFAFLGMYFCKSVIAYFIFNAALGVFRSAFNAASRAYIYLIVTAKQRLLASRELLKRDVSTLIRTHN